MDNKTKYIIFGVVAVGIVALIVMSKNSSSSFSPSSDAINGIVASNMNAQNQSVALVSKQLDTAAAIEEAILNANTNVKISAQNNATELAAKQIDATTAISETQIEGNTSMFNTNAQVSASEANTQTQAKAATNIGWANALGNVASSVLSIFGGKSKPAPAPTVSAPSYPTGVWA